MTKVLTYDEQKVIEAKHRAYVTKLQKESPDVAPISLNDFAESFKENEQNNEIEITEAIKHAVGRFGFGVTEYQKQKGQTKGKFNNYLQNDKAKISAGFMLMTKDGMKVAKERLEANLNAVNAVLELI